jgi:cytochrome c oxidase subunit 2
MISSKLSINVMYDIPEPYQMGFQDPACNMMEGLINFHHDIMTFLAFIATFVLWFLIRIVFHFQDDTIRVKTINHNTTLEIVWTAAPAFILMSIGLPSFALMYSMDELRSPMLTLKVAGHQWYWFYELPSASFNSLSQSTETGNWIEGEILSRFEIESHMNPANLVGAFRLADVSMSIMLPTKINIRILVTSVDVLHSWAVPALGLKVDACPGRLNQLWVNIKREGAYYGQCSEICGVNHAFMPILIIAVRYHEFFNWQLVHTNFAFNE